MQNITCRWVKCHGPNPIRSATGGLAAKLKSTPNPISAISANNNSRSTVHHHSAMGVFRSRENQAEMAVTGILRYAGRAQNCRMRNYHPSGYHFATMMPWPENLSPPHHPRAILLPRPHQRRGCIRASGEGGIGEGGAWVRALGPHRPSGTSIPSDRPIRVPCGSPQGRPKADGWPGEDGSPRRTPERERGTDGRLAGKVGTGFPVRQPTH